MVGEGGRVRGIALPTRATALGPHPEALGGAAVGALRAPRTAQIAFGLRFICSMSR